MYGHRIGQVRAHLLLLAKQPGNLSLAYGSRVQGFGQ